MFYRLAPNYKIGFRDIENSNTRTKKKKKKIKMQ